MSNERIRIEMKIGDRDVAVEAPTESAALAMLRALEKEYGNKTEPTPTLSTIEHVSKPRRSSKNKLTVLEIPTPEQLVDYLLKKPQYEHDVLEIEDVFWGKHITARENETQYRKLHNNLGKARHKIETMKQGKFEQHLTKSKNLKKYIFKPITQTLMGTLNGKTSPPS